MFLALTVSQLKAFDGSDPAKPIYMGVNGKVFDVNADKSFYGPEGNYSIFAGKDATKMTKKKEDCCASLDGLTEEDMKTLADWEKKFQAKYLVVATLAE